jgi:hypothetical protein
VALFQLEGSLNGETEFEHVRFNKKGCGCSKPESGKKWKDVNCGSGQQGRSFYLSFIYRLKLGKVFRGAYNRFWNVKCFQKTLRFG